MTEENSTAPDPTVRLYVEDWGGDGPVVLLIHGWLLSGASWEKQIHPLRDAGFRVITYDRRGFGESDKPENGYDYDTLAADLDRLLRTKDLRDVTLVGFSMGGGEVARYVAKHGQNRLRAVVFASAVPPCLAKAPANPDGPLTGEAAAEMEKGLRADREAFFQQFAVNLFSANGGVKASEAERDKVVTLARQSGEAAAAGCLEAFATTDFRRDLAEISVPTLVLHGDADAIVPIEGSGARTHAAIAGSEFVVIPGAPHGCAVSHAAEFNDALISFLKRLG